MSRGRELYLQEKSRRATAQRTTETDLRLAEAKRQYDAMLAAEAASGKGGRPRKIVTRSRARDAFGDDK
jgi:hypothetical protein